eukprot:CAMPEP_0172855146 /NCGR_PEP_ID=MMETSP1075-20121228/60295_1 /TAXON_ID=2916 /ORGANISM="Ceratium fusus, Strain PA161109" /LENGTH=30 /DNA_ID= /DNA_START= /DNA_END= /DNA_ORIENTATION=
MSACKRGVAEGGACASGNAVKRMQHGRGLE